MSEEKQGNTWADMFNYNNMFISLNNLPGQNQTMEPFTRLAKIQQQHCLEISRCWVDCLWILAEASRSGNVREVWETCLESNKKLMASCQKSMKEQAEARYELWRNAMSALTSPRSATA